MLFLALGLRLAGPLPVALAATPVTQTPAAVVVQTERAIPTEDAETFDGTAHDAQLAATGAQRNLLLTLGGLLRVGAGLAEWWVSRQSTSRH